jgi:hypothetical protein
MNYNKNSGWGQIVGQLPFTGSGKVFAVGDSSTANRDMLADLFDVDADGVVRFFSTIDAAIGACTANAGDVIFVMPGHSETVSAASGIIADVAGVSIIGLGNGADRPTITFGTSTAASFDVTAASVKVKNIVGLAGIDGLTKPFLVSGDNCEIDIEWQDASAAVEAATAVRLDTANNSKLKLKYLGFTGGNAAVRVVAVDDCDNVSIDIDAYGIVSTAWVNMVDAASTNVSVRGRLYTHGITNFTRDVVDTVTGSTWDAVIFDASAGATVAGGSAAALAVDDISAVAAAVTATSTEVGTVFAVFKTVVQNTVVAAGAAVTGASSGYLELIGAYVQNGSTQMDSAGNAGVFNLYSNNVIGAGTFFTAAEALLLANAVVGPNNASSFSGGVMLETGKVISYKATTEDFTSGGNVSIILVFRRLSAGATVAAA